MTLILLQARMGSTRLPGKVMREVLGRPMIDLMIERLSQAKKADKIVVATSVNQENNGMCDFLKKRGIEVYRGSEEDVLDRFYRAASHYSADTVVRVTADCPLIDPQIIDEVIAHYEKNKLDYAATASDSPGYPDGLDVEVFSFQMLEVAWKNAHAPSQREHVTPFITDSKKYKTGIYRPKQDYAGKRWTVDHEEDLELIRSVFEALYPQSPVFGMKDVLAYEAAHPMIFEVNRHIERNEGYKKSLEQDRVRLVSVVLAVHNGEKYLSEQLESVCAQKYDHLEILVMDDASTDRSVSIALEKAKTDERIRVVVNERNIGLVSNFIKGASMTRGEYVCFCDQDDVWHPEKVATLKNILKADPERMMVYSDLEVCNERMETILPSFLKASRILPRQGNLHERAFLKNIAPGCSMMFKHPVKELISVLWADENFRRLNRAEVLDETPVMHDHLAQILSAGLGKVVYTPKALVRYRQHDQNSIGAFYRARRGNDPFVRALELRMEALKPLEERLPRMDWPALRNFLEEYRRPRRAPMPARMGYFLWMRNNTLADKALGALDCLMPSFYLKLKTSLRG